MLLFFLFLTSLAQAATVSWSGVDYELVWLIDGSRFLHEGELFPHNARLWNQEFREQTLPGLGPRMGVDIVDTTAQTDELRLGMTRYGHVFDMPHAVGTPMLEPADIELRLADYPPGDKGISLALVADHLDGAAKKGCYWVTFYETRSRAPLSMDFRCGTASGAPDERWVRAQHAVAATLRNEDLPRKAMEGASESELAAARKRQELAAARAREAGNDERVRDDLRARTHTPDLFEAEIELDEGDYSHLEDDDLHDEVQGELSAIDAELLAADEQRGRKGLFSREKADWVTIRVPPHALQTLTDAGVPYDERPAFTSSLSLGGSGQPGTSTAREDLPGYDCMRAYGKEACGWDCKTAYGDVKCAQSPGGACKVAFGEITCTGGGGYPDGPESECVTSFGQTACGWDCKTAYGKVRCAQSPHGRCEAKFGDITCTP